MPNINEWAGSTFPLSGWSGELDQAYDTARLINDDLTSITVNRAGGDLSAQNVRVETKPSGNRTVLVNGVVHEVDAIVFGFRSHPTITDTDLQAGDRFMVDGVRLEVIAVLVDLENVIQAICEAKA